MAKKDTKLQEIDDLLTALYKELEATGTSTFLDRRKRSQLLSQIKEIENRYGDLQELYDYMESSGIKGKMASKLVQWNQNRPRRVKRGLAAARDNLGFIGSNLDGSRLKDFGRNIVDTIGTANIVDTTGIAPTLTDDQINAYISGREETGKGDVLEQLGMGKVGDVRRLRADDFPRLKKRWEQGFPRLKDFGKNIYDTMAMVNMADTTGMAQPLTEDQIITASENGVQDVLGFGGDLKPDSNVDQDSSSNMYDISPVDHIPFNSYEEARRYEEFVDSPKWEESVPSGSFEEPIAPERGEINLRSHVPFGAYTGELKDKFGNPSVPLEKLGRSQRASLEKRLKQVALYPDAFSEDYATPEAIYYNYAQGGQMNLAQQAQNVASQGRYGDSMLMHVNPAEVRGLSQVMPLTRNPQTGQPEAFLPFLAPILGSLAGGALFSGSIGALGASALGSGLAQWAATGDLKKGLLAGITGYGIGSALQGAGAAAEATKAATDATRTATEVATQQALQNPALATSGALNPAGTLNVSGQVAQQMPAITQQAGQEAATYLARDPSILAAGKDAFSGGFGQGAKNLATGLMQPSAIAPIAMGMAPTAVMESEEAYQRQLAQREKEESEAKRQLYQDYPEPILYSASGGRTGYREGGSSGGGIFGGMGGGIFDDDINMFSGDQQRFTPARQAYDINPEFMAGFQPETMYFNPATINQPATATRAGAAPSVQDTYTGSKGGYNMMGVAPAPMTTIDPYKPYTGFAPEGLVETGYAQYPGDIPDPELPPVIPPITDPITIPDIPNIPDIPWNSPWGPLGPVVGSGPSISQPINVTFDPLSEEMVPKIPPALGGYTNPTIPTMEPYIAASSFAEPVGEPIMPPIGITDTSVFPSEDSMPWFEEDSMPAIMPPIDMSGFTMPDIQSMPNISAPIPQVAPTPQVVPMPQVAPTTTMPTVAPTPQVVPMPAITMPTAPLVRPSLHVDPQRGVRGGVRGGKGSVPSMPAFDPNLGQPPKQLDVLPTFPSLDNMISAPDIDSLLAAEQGIPIDEQEEERKRRGVRKPPPRGFATGGMTDIMNDPLTQETIKFILGESDNQQVLNDFVEKYGPEIFMQLRDSILQGVAPDAQTEGQIEGVGNGGMADDINGVIGNQEQIAVSQDEFIVPADVVSMLGDGSSDAGSDRLYEMMDRVRQEKTGTAQQAPRLNVGGVLPA